MAMICQQTLRNHVNLFNSHPARILFSFQEHKWCWWCHFVLALLLHSLSTNHKVRSLSGIQFALQLQMQGSVSEMPLEESRVTWLVTCPLEEGGHTTLFTIFFSNFIVKPALATKLQTPPLKLLKTRYISLQTIHNLRFLTIQPSHEVWADNYCVERILFMLLIVDYE